MSSRSGNYQPTSNGGASNGGLSLVGRQHSNDCFNTSSSSTCSPTHLDGGSRSKQGPNSYDSTDSTGAGRWSINTLGSNGSRHSMGGIPAPGGELHHHPVSPAKTHQQQFIGAGNGGGGAINAHEGSAAVRKGVKNEGKYKPSKEGAGVSFAPSTKGGKDSANDGEKSPKAIRPELALYGYNVKQDLRPVDPDAPVTDHFSWDQVLMNNICTFLPQRASLRAASVSKRWRGKVLVGFNPREAIDKQRARDIYAEKLEEDQQGVGVGRAFFLIQNIGLLLIVGCSFANASASADEDSNATLSLAVALFGMLIIVCIGVFLFCAAGNKGCKNVFKEMVMQIALSVVICIVMFPVSYMWEDYRILASDVLVAGVGATCGTSLENVYVTEVKVPAIWTANGSWLAGPSAKYTGQVYIPISYSNGTGLSTSACIPAIHLFEGQEMTASTTGGGLNPIQKVIARGLWWRQPPAVKELYREHFLSHPTVPLVDMGADIPEGDAGGLLTGILILYLVVFLGMVSSVAYFVLVTIGRAKMSSRLDSYEESVSLHKVLRDKWHKKMRHGEVYDDVKAEEMQRAARRLKPGQAIVNVGGWTTEA